MIDKVFWNAFTKGDQAKTFIKDLTSPTEISKIAIISGELDNDEIHGNDDDVQKLMDRAKEDGNMND